MLQKKLKKKFPGGKKAWIGAFFKINLHIYDKWYPELIMPWPLMQVEYQLVNYYFTFDVENHVAENTLFQRWETIQLMAVMKYQHTNVVHDKLFLGLMLLCYCLQFQGECQILPTHNLVLHQRNHVVENSFLLVRRSKHNISNGLELYTFRTNAYGCNGSSLWSLKRRSSAWFSDGFSNDCDVLKFQSNGCRQQEDVNSQLGLSMTNPLFKNLNLLILSPISTS